MDNQDIDEESFQYETLFLVRMSTKTVRNQIIALASGYDVVQFMLHWVKNTCACQYKQNNYVYVS